MDGIEKYIWFSAWGESLSIPLQLQRMGKTVIVALVDDMKTVGSKEDPDEYKLRIGNYKGLLHIQSAESTIERMRGMANKDEWFVFFDFNILYPYAEEAVSMGFTKGLFPTKFDYVLENDRQMGKKFVAKYYPDVEVAESQEFKSIDDGIEFLQDQEDFWALKSNDPSGSTVVPDTLDAFFASEELIDALVTNRKDYESKGFILEKQIRDGTEFCPEMIFWDGEPIAMAIDLENKTIGGANKGQKVGCMQNLICVTPIDTPLTDIAFPSGMMRLAKKHRGLFYADINLIYKDGLYYYLEFCAARPGYDAIFSEIDMSDGADNYFESLAEGSSPFVRSYGAAVRALNHNQDDKHMVQKDLTLRWKEEVEGHIWPFEMKKKDGRILNVGISKDLFCVTESSDDAEYAVLKTYDLLEKVSFKEAHVRSKEDFLSKSYYTSIMNRLEVIHSLSPVPLVEGASETKKY